MSNKGAKHTIKVGDRFKNNKGVWVVVIKYINSKKILIRFEDSLSTEKYTSSSSLYKGSLINVSDPFNIIGKRFINKTGDCCKVLQWKSHKEVTVEFEGFAGKFFTFQYGALRRGGFRNPNKPVIFGVGFIGDGEYSSKRGKDYFIYVVWYNMLARCYDDRLQEKFPAYIGCTVHEDWHNFQSFAEWYHNHEFFGLGYELDKDLIVKGNKIYSPENCTLIPKWLNNMIKISCKTGNGLPIGVTRKGCKYRARVTDSSEGVEMYIGSFDTKEEASAMYVKEKENLVRRKYEVLSGIISERAQEAVMNWTVYP